MFPECFVSLYPSGAWAAPAATWTDGLRRAVGADVGVERRRRAGRSSSDWPRRARTRGVHLAIGVNEREDDRPGSLYNTLLVIGPEGVVHRHRKLMPTMHERVFHGVGAGDDLGVVDAARRAAGSAG